MVKSIELQHVSKSFGKLGVLEDIQLQIEKGQFAAIVGPSGCGKSTILRMVAGLEFPEKGKVMANGEPVTQPSTDRMLIFQEHALYPWLTVERNISLGLELAHIPKNERHERVKQVLETVGLQGFEKYYPSQLSGGMRQRVSIARALVMNPETLLLDEPYGALDAMTRLTMQNELIDLWSGTEKTMLLITHDIDEAIYLADRIFVMSARPGRVVRTFDVQMARPRNRNGEEFFKLRQEIMGILGFGDEMQDIRVAMGGAM